ncbi:hypothetical protein H0486_16915 [Lachnospiraceae bacterium MD1]|jgi:hypothetical protein|uniref:N-acetyltransferase domain-containing protein n=1 Tax=Variimorphobacter saccharofermentans TaxID=2755051 RepID=A0A839K5U7_9FIRM|nr:GNAT family N-acetyltransferase [Variimorphobacter saccharofermentans]MBB2184562.1 hypothetical protein [Variimorphobacter saccharofermentans]
MLKFHGFTAKKLEISEVVIAKELCDKHIGKGMYPEEFLYDIIYKNNHFFYLVYKEDKAIGFFYCVVLLPYDLAELPGFGEAFMYHDCSENDIIGVCRSIGIDEAYRGMHLTDELLQYFTSYLFNEAGVSVIFIPAWVKGSYIPAKRLLEDNNYQFLCYLEKPWYQSDLLECPYCRTRRCICDAVIYYMSKETYYEICEAI